MDKEAFPDTSVAFSENAIEDINAIIIDNGGWREGLSVSKLCELILDESSDTRSTYSLGLHGAMDIMGVLPYLGRIGDHLKVRNIHKIDGGLNIAVEVANGGNETSFGKR